MSVPNPYQPNPPLPPNPYQTPGFGPPALPPGIGPVKMPITQVLFSLSGRIPRRTYWLWHLLSSAPLFFLIVLSGFAAPNQSPGAVESHRSYQGNEQVESEESGARYQTHSSPEPGPGPGKGILIATIPVLLILILAAWINIAVTVKRWHDRGQSGGMFFVALIPLVGPIWTLIECGCTRGTFGPNQYGPDPT